MLRDYIYPIENYVPVEIELKEDDDFLKVKETLTRIGIPSKTSNKLFQSAHILHKRGRFFIVHFKELFALDGKEVNLDENDVQRRNTIAKLLEEWGLMKIVNKNEINDFAPMSQIKIISYKDKDKWELLPKYSIGNSSYYNQ